MLHCGGTPACRVFAESRLQNHFSLFLRCLGICSTAQNNHMQHEANKTLAAATPFAPLPFLRMTYNSREMFTRFW